MKWVYPFLHLFFGWDFISWESEDDWGISRVHISNDGVVWFYPYLTSGYIAEITHEMVDDHSVMFLTCFADEYLGEKDGQTN